MNDKLSFPSISSLHGLFAQGRMQPELITIFKGWTRLTTDRHGEMRDNPLEGFFCAETQLLCEHQLLVNESPLVHRFSVQLASNEWASTGAVLSAGEGGNLPEGTVPNGTLEVTVLRRIEQGMTETIYVRNNGTPSQKVALKLKLVCPIRDVEFQEEMKKGESSPALGLKPSIQSLDQKTILMFKRDFGKRLTPAPPLNEISLSGESIPKEGGNVIRALKLTVKQENVSPHFSVKGDLNYAIELEAQKQLSACEEFWFELKYEPIIDGIFIEAPELKGLEPLPRLKSNLPSDSIEIVTSHSTLNLILGQALVDLESLQLPVFGHSEALNGDTDYRSLIAGIPRYIGLFGRDSVIAAKQSALFAPHYLNSSLARLGALQGRNFDDWRDEEPNRLPHEQRLDPESAVGKHNRDIYFGDVTSTPYWIMTLHEMYQWSGDLVALRKHQKTLEGCCDWILRRLKVGGGFIYYFPTAPKSGPANRNQAWKDSGDAIVDERGGVCVPPLALIEIQAYAYQALNQAAELFRDLGRDEFHLDLKQKARDLKKRFEEKFWLNEGFYALGLNSSGEPIRTHASNVGHCLSTGILRPDTVESVVKGLLAEDMFSGWGIRTLSSQNPSYDPMSYHRGAVWPVENAIIAEGMARLGYRLEANQIITAQLSLAAVFQHMRLPEVFGGQSRSTRSPAPGMYSFANALQAWSVSAVSQFISTLLGLTPRAAQGRLEIDPHLPEWLSWIELKQIKVGSERIHLHAWRTENGKTEWKATSSEAGIHLECGT